MMTHLPTADDYKYFVHAPKLPCTARRAPPQQASKPLHQARQEEEGTSDGTIADSSGAIEISKWF